ncbi:MAG: hypothetical protein AAB472_03910 [Patescibacteria group bacterium]
MARALLIIVLILVLGYGAWKAFPLLAGPDLVIETPTEGQSFPGGFVEITGIAKHSERLSLNGGPLLIDESGHFSTSIVVAPGGAILSLTATDRFGKTTTVRRSVFVPNP